MPDASNLTQQELVTNVDLLAGREVTRVTYRVFPHHRGAGQFHECLVAVELTSTIGITCFTWGDAFGQFSIEVRHGPLDSPGDDLLAVEVTDHEGWKERLPANLRSASLVWGMAATEDNLPIAVRLQFDSGAVWIASGERKTDGGWWFGMDEVTVMFGDEVAIESGLSPDAQGLA